MEDFFIQHNQTTDVKQLTFDYLLLMKTTIDHTYSYNYTSLHQSEFYKQLPH